MMVSQGFYSRLVAWLKILLPLVALGILSTVFFLARAPEVDRSIPYATPDGDPVTTQDLIANPSFVAVTKDGAAITLRADIVRPEGNDSQILLADRLSSVLQTSEGRRITSRSESGRIDLDGGVADFLGSVSLNTTDGFSLTARDVRARLDRVELRTDLPVSATTPMGDLQAGSLVVTQTETGGYVLVFNNGVELIYAPER